MYLSGNAADYLSKVWVILVGIDALSVKQKGSDDLRAHESLLGAGILILKGLNLNNVNSRKCELIALPLRLRGLNGSLVRAVLQK